MLASRAKIPDEPKAASSEVVGFDIIISAGKQAIQVVKGVDGCMRRLPHVYQVCAFWCNSGHATRLCVVHASSEITCWHLQQTRLTLKQVAGRIKEGTTWGGGGSLQVDGKELKGDAEVAAEGERLMHVHHTAAGLPVLHATTALSATKLPDASNHYSQLLTPRITVSSMRHTGHRQGEGKRRAGGVR